MGTARKILSNTMFQIIGKAGTALLSFVVIKVIALYLGPDKYGVYTNVYEFLALFAIIADFGLYTIAVREMSKDEKKIPEVLGNILTIRLVVGVIVLIGVIVGGFFVPKHQGTQIPYAIMIATTASFIALLNGTITSVLQEKYNMKYSAMAMIIGKAFQVLYMVLTAYVLFNGDTYYGFYHLFVAGVLGNLVMLAITVSIVRRYTEIRPRFDKARMKYLLKQAAPYGLALFLSNIYFRADALLLFNLRADGEQQAGLYGIAARMLEALVLLPLYFMNAVLPTLTKHIHEKRESYKTILQYIFDFQVMLSVPFLVGGFLLATPLIYAVASPEFVSGFKGLEYGSDVALQIVLFAFVLLSLNVIFNYTLIAIGKQAKLIWINGACALFNVVANIIFIPILGFRGAAFTTVASELLVFVMVIITVRRYLPFSIKLNRAFKVIISAFLMGVVVYLLKDSLWNVIGYSCILVLVPVGAAVYAASLFGTKAVTKDLLKQMLQR